MSIGDDCLKLSRQKLTKIYNRLSSEYGPRNWWPGKTKFEVIVGAILVQNVAWSNAKKAIKNLKSKNLLNPEALHKYPLSKLAPLIKSSRFYNQKAQKLKNFTSFLMKNYDGSLKKMFNTDVEILRKELLGINGLGFETVDSILLYAGNKLSFVSDAYTKRFLHRYGLIGDKVKYNEIRQLFMDNLPNDLKLYNEYHALIVHHGALTCQSKPLCETCSVKSLGRSSYCKYYENSILR